MRDFTRPLRVTDDVYWVGVNDRRKVRFENQGLRGWRRWRSSPHQWLRQLMK
ncbi:MAG: hypothetical protein L7G91_04270 [Acidilobus sp.]|nr:hypothetical protein [Acidilobus sp.]MCG2891381.1 hypothetical protein [Acidilobus sp.]